MKYARAWLSAGLGLILSLTITAYSYTDYWKNCFGCGPYTPDGLTYIGPSDWVWVSEGLFLWALFFGIIYGLARIASKLLKAKK